MLGETLKQLMTEKGMTQTDLHNATGISKPSISQYVKGQTEPPLDKKKLIANALGVEIKFFLEEKPKKPLRPPKTIIESIEKYTIEEAAKRCGKAKKFISDWLNRSDCPFGHIEKGTTGKPDPFIPKARLEKYLAGEL